MSRLVFISDTHKQHWNVKVPDGDVLIHCGDITGNGEVEAFSSFSAWLTTLPHKHKIVIPGNHDLLFERDEKLARSLFHPSINILINQEVILDGVKYYGSPHTPRFFDWAYMLTRGTHAKACWDLVPEDTDVLITHGPAFGILDRNSQGHPCGCLDLLNRIAKIQPKIHAFGHIHEGHGALKLEWLPNTLFINASTCTAAYKPKNSPIVVDL